MGRCAVRREEKDEQERIDSHGLTRCHARADGGSFRIAVATKSNIARILSQEQDNLFGFNNLKLSLLQYRHYINNII